MDTETASADIKAGSDGELLLVLDKTATATVPIRRHEVLLDDGTATIYEFKYGKMVKMPRAHAMRFARLKEAFEVKDQNGNKVFPPEIVSAHGGRIGEPFRPPVGACIARYEELTAEALVNRANLVPGGLHFTARTKKAELVNFLTGVDEKRERELVSAKDRLDITDADAIGGEMSDEEMKALFKDE